MQDTKDSWGFDDDGVVSGGGGGGGVDSGSGCHFATTCKTFLLFTIYKQRKYKYKYFTLINNIQPFNSIHFNSSKFVLIDNFIYKCVMGVGFFFKITEISSINYNRSLDGLA